MKKVKINALPLPSFGGDFIGYVISKYNGKGMLCKPVYKRRVKKSPRQLEIQERFTEAIQYAKHVLGNLEKREAYERKLKKINGSLYPAIVADYFKNGEWQVEDCKRTKSSPFRGKGRGNSRNKSGMTVPKPSTQNPKLEANN